MSHNNSVIKSKIIGKKLFKKTVYNRYRGYSPQEILDTVDKFTLKTFLNNEKKDGN